MSAFKIENFVDGDVIFKIGDPANNLYILSDGQVDLLDDNGFVFDQIQKGEPFGEAAFLNGGFRSATVRAKGNVVCKKIRFVSKNCGRALARVACQVHDTRPVLWP